MLAHSSPPTLPSLPLSFDPIDSQEIVYPNNNNSSDETADDYERTSSARSMSSLATSVDSQESASHNNQHTQKSISKNDYFVDLKSNQSSGTTTTSSKYEEASSEATTPTGVVLKQPSQHNVSSSDHQSKHPSILIPNGSAANSPKADASSTSPKTGSGSPKSPALSPSPTTNFARPLRQSSEYKGSSLSPSSSSQVQSQAQSQQHLPMNPKNNNSSSSLPASLSQRSSSTSAISRVSTGEPHVNRDPGIQPNRMPPPPRSQSHQKKSPTQSQQTSPVLQQHLQSFPQSSSSSQHLQNQNQTAATTASISSPQRNRSSISSQLSNASQHSLYRTSTATGSHRPSFSFSRRRSLAGQGVSRNSVQIDDSSASAQDIERLREMIVAQRESKRKRREFLEDERVLVGTKVSEGDDNFVTAYNMLTGIRVSVSRCNAKISHELTDADFKAKNKLAFDIGGNELTPSAKYDFKFKDYAPYVFRHLREMFRLDPADYLISLTAKYIVSELGSPGKSGSFFYFSRDYRFIIKTIHHSEHKMLRKILKDYYNHVKNNPNTLISQFYGLHRVKLPFGRKIHFIVMNNLFPPHRDIHRTYDLKGSTLGRYLPDSSSQAQRRSVVYKDLNWLKHNESIKLGPTKRADFIKQLEVDVELLKRLNIMDYSLLIGIHDLNKGNTEHIRDSTLSVFEPKNETLSRVKVAELRKALNATSPTALNGMDFAFEEYMRRDFKFYADSGGYRSTNENEENLNEIYYLGVIDCLTPYTFAKRIETFWKGLSHTRPSISAVPAQEYGDRFLAFIKSIVQQQKHQTSDRASGSGAQEGSSTQAQHLPALSESSTEQSPEQQQLLLHQEQ